MLEWFQNGMRFFNVYFSQLNDGGVFDKYVCCYVELIGIIINLMVVMII